MLVLKRKQGQAIDVGGNVRIILKEVRGGHVKVAIVAPKEVRVTRSEVRQSIEVENRKAAGCLEFSCTPGGEVPAALDRIDDMVSPAVEGKP
jgi:carbon storage regulator